MADAGLHLLTDLCFVLPYIKRGQQSEIVAIAAWMMRGYASFVINRQKFLDSIIRINLRRGKDRVA